MKRSARPWIWLLFIGYCALMLWLLFDRASAWNEDLTYRQMLEGNINLTPLQTIKNYWNVVVHRTNDDYLSHCIINLVGNVIMFVPIGYWMPALFKKQRNFFLFLLTCAAGICLVETAQLFSLRGSFDVDDIILNLAGLAIGYLVYTLSHIKKRR